MADKAAGGEDPRRGNNVGAEGGAGYGSSGDNGRREASGTGISTDQILQTGGLLLRSFIEDRVQRDPNAAGVDVPELHVEDQVPVNPSTKRLSECLRKIGDELDGNMELQRCEGLLSYFGTPTWQTVGVFLAGVLTATVAIWKYT
uniref:Uncharacterized protein n=1 Tax=Pyxicephalus adspersus TaxID=30357 RepID=A0AAV2ZX04_PYXAD|nr:TPA: hypothetical protein GDO54_003470 [Pyxicephalus adspersus]